MKWRIIDITGAEIPPALGQPNACKALATTRQGGRASVSTLRNASQRAGLGLLAASGAGEGAFPLDCCAQRAFCVFRLVGYIAPHAARGREVAGYIADKPRRHVKARTHRRGTL